jgi:hypothetical protein
MSEPRMLCLGLRSPENKRLNTELPSILPQSQSLSETAFTFTSTSLPFGTGFFYFFELKCVDSIVRFVDDCFQIVGNCFMTTLKYTIDVAVFGKSAHSLINGGLFQIAILFYSKNRVSNGISAKKLLILSVRTVSFCLL